MSESIRISAYGTLRARLRSPEVLNLHKPDAAGHVAQFYERDETVVTSVAHLARKTLRQGDSVVLIATRAHLRAMEAVVNAACSLGQLRERGRYLALDADATLSLIIDNGFPDETRFDDAVGSFVRKASEASTNGFMFAFGEMVALLCQENRRDAALHLERLWNALALRHRFSLYCAYPLSAFGAHPDLESLLSICAEHSISIPAE